MRVGDEGARLAVFQSWARAGHGRAGPIIPSVLRGETLFGGVGPSRSTPAQPSGLVRAAAPPSAQALPPSSFPFATDPHMTAEHQPLLARRRRRQTLLSPHTLTRPLLLLTLADALLESAAYARLHVLTTCQTVRPLLVSVFSLSLPKALMTIEI